MSIRTQAAADWKANVDADMDIVVLIDTEANEYTMKGMVFRVDEKLDPETGVKVYEPHTSVTVSLADITGTLSESWTCETTDVTGADVVGFVRSPRFNRTNGTATFDIEPYEEEAGE